MGVITKEEYLQSREANFADVLDEEADERKKADAARAERVRKSMASINGNPGK